ncbi:TonB-dependent receptor plug domain-containing protein [Ketobacter alkanivorans]|uniref:TonB-dependent receptor plug domain-containing protein n=1 Tax=Ketobacter alkanivorans TaxID=1917421 RepID=UPI0013154217|nr:TonB-dependent receptor [Ketobacter alkanivorans]
MKPRAIPLACLFAYALTVAEPSQASNLFELDLEELLQISVTGATLTDSNSLQAPAAITLFSRADIATMPISTLDELMNYVPGGQAYRTTDMSNHQPFSLRSKRSGSSTSELLILVNGARIDNPFSGGITIPYPAIPLANIDRVEIIRGPTSSLHGSNAYSGVINIITVQNENRSYGEAGTDDHYRLGSINTFSSSTLKGSLFLEAQKDNGQAFSVMDQFGDGQRNTRDQYSTLDANLSLTLAERTRVQVLANEREVDGFYLLGTVDDQYNQWETHYYNIMLEHKATFLDQVETTLQLGYVRNEYEATSRAITPIEIGTISTPTSDAPLLIHPTIDTQETWARLFNNWTLDEQRSIQVGLEYQNTDVMKAFTASNYDLGALASFTLPIAYFDNMDYRIDAVSRFEKERNYGALLQWQETFSDQLQLTTGIRYDSYSLSDEQVSPRLGLVYHQNENNTFKLLYGRAFRAPKYTELLTANNGIIEGNEDLKSETVDTLEAIWLNHWQFSTLAVSLFHNTFQDPIIQIVEDNIRKVVNAENTSSDGAELELLWKANASLAIRANAAIVFNQPDIDRKEANRLFSIIVDYKIFDWNLNLSSHYADQRETRYDDEVKPYDSYWLANIKAMRSMPNGLSPYIEIRNLADVTYSTPASSSAPQQGTPNRGRELRLGCQWNY